MGIFITTNQKNFFKPNFINFIIDKVKNGW